MCPAGKLPTQAIIAIADISQVDAPMIEAVDKNYALLPGDTEGVTIHLVRQLAAGDELKWTTPIPPAAAARVTLVFTGGIGYTSQPATGWELQINGKPGVAFDIFAPDRTVAKPWTRSSDAGDVVLE